MAKNQSPCPICKSRSNQLFPVDVNLKRNLSKIGVKKIPSQICSSCYKNVSQKISGNFENKSSAFSNHEKNRAMIWKQRTILLKKAQKLFEQKVFSRAATHFEQYLRIVEAVNKKKQHQLTPEVFSKSSRSRELTVVTSVYWSLLRIYDMNDKTESQMNLCAKKLSSFLPYSYIYNEIMRKSKSILKSVRNPKVFKDCFKSAKRSHKRCFIATSAFQSPLAPEVKRLRKFKTEYLKNKKGGKLFIAFYNRFSPHIATWLDKNPAFKPLVRLILRRILSFLPARKDKDKL